MLLDAQGLEPDAELEADLCIVGAGAAGITIARELVGGPLAVVVLESGGLQYEEKVQDLYAGRAEGPLLGAESGYLTASRLRYFGGTTNHWQGWCRPLDPEDFQVRDWVAPDGWPLTYEELQPFYKRAAEVVEVRRFDEDRSRTALTAPLLGDDPVFETTFFHLSPPTRFGQRYREELATARNVRVLTHAGAVCIAADAGGSQVVRIHAARPGGRRLRVRARVYVLASGAIENARLLLASNDIQPRGLGNDRDLVGRYFMDHPSVRVGQVVLPYWRRLMLPYDQIGRGGGRQRARAALRLRPDLQRRHRLLDSMVVFDTLSAEEPLELAPQVADFAIDLLQLASRSPDPKVGTTYFGSMRMESEATPDPRNRVTLTEERDPLGMPRVRLEWRLSPQEEASQRATAQWLARRLGERLQGRAQLLIHGEALRQRTHGSSHHMGTTRMAATAERGVVDADCRVHGLENLYVAGSSVFPTSGCSNPTLTIVALALRLADHLRERLAR